MEGFSEMELDTLVVVFRFKGSDQPPLALDVIEASEALVGIVDSTDAATKEANVGWHRAKLQEWLTGKGFPTYKDGELESLWHGIQVAHAKKKREQHEELERMRSSPASTE